VTGLHCYFRFDPLEPDYPSEQVKAVFDPLGVPVIIKDVSDDFLKLVLDPPHGYGKCINPCIDCKIFFITFAKKMMEEIGARFIVTGEVVGQRPMSQMRPTLQHIQKEAEMKGLILRPLSAKILDETLPEREGWVDRNQLYGISGRSRKDQMEIAGTLGIQTYNQPAGGCILTIPEYANRAKRLFQNRGKDSISLSDMRKLRLGRHLWPSDHLHVIVGRKEEENDMLMKLAEEDWRFEAADIAGPLVLATGIASDEDIRTVASITARYCGHKAEGEVRIGYTHPNGTGEILILKTGRSIPEEWIV
jgi:tRNA-specific 2-thiouridylase